MKNRPLLYLAGIALLLAACKDKPKEIPNVARAQAAQDASEAEFATQIRDFPRAEDLLKKAVSLDPENSRYWKVLGVVRLKRGDKPAAKKAYEKARDLSWTEYRRSGKKNLEAALNEMELCVLLGKTDEARTVLSSAARDNPDDARLRELVDQKIIDKMLTDPAVKAASI